VSVNVSAAQLQRPDFIRIVEGALAASGLSPQRLEIEITESLFIDAATVALGHLHALRARGVQVALDDFGTGYSSLAYLRRFPFDTLKIDRAFVRELMTRHDARAIVRTIIDLARTLGMHTLAEGVEEPAQLEVLREAGCAAIQGYLVARPMPLQALNQLLANWTRQPAAQASASPLPGRGVVLRQVAADGG
jgi:EAL domain-containing protein (putative c-di-GMP-specific phosphodiesterase class I)